MKEFPPKNNPQNHAAQTQARDTQDLETLQQVFDAWQNNQQIIQWTHKQGLSESELAARMKMFKISLYGFNSLLFVIAICIPIFSNLDRSLAITLAAMILGFSILDWFVAVPITLKNIAKNLSATTNIKIDRSQKIVIITAQQQTQELRYGSNASLPAFRLPEQAREEHIQMRRQLQSEITAETGMSFAENT